MRLLRHELKLALTPDEAEEVESWARNQLKIDVHTPEGADGYELHTLYLDNDDLSVFHSDLPARGVKYRIRRYGDEAVAYLERKKRKGTCVTKRRAAFPIDRLPDILNRSKKLKGWEGRFQQWVRAHGLRPMVLMNYRRAAFCGPSGIRLTIDRRICASRSNEISSLHANGEAVSATDEFVLELKYNGDIMPECFEQLLIDHKQLPGAFSKYGKGVRALGLAQVDNRND